MANCKTNSSRPIARSTTCTCSLLHCPRVTRVVLPYECHMRTARVAPECLVVWMSHRPTANVWLGVRATVRERARGEGPRGPILVRLRPPPPLLQTPKWLYRTMGFVGAGGARDFVLGIGQGEIFLFDPMCLYSKCSEFCGEFKNG